MIAHLEHFSLKPMPFLPKPLGFMDTSHAPKHCEAKQHCGDQPMWRSACVGMFLQVQLEPVPEHQLAATDDGKHQALRHQPSTRARRAVGGKGTSGQENGASCASGFWCWKGRRGGAKKLAPAEDGCRAAPLGDTSTPHALSAQRGSRKGLCKTSLWP